MVTQRPFTNKEKIKLLKTVLKAIENTVDDYEKENVLADIEWEKSEEILYEEIMENGLLIYDNVTSIELFLKLSINRKTKKIKPIILSVKKKKKRPA